MTRGRWDGRLAVQHETRLVLDCERRCRDMSHNGLRCTRIAGHDGWHRHYSRAESGQPAREEWWE